MKARLVALGVVVGCALAPLWGQAPPTTKPGLPRVVLLGDSIRHGYAPLVAKALVGQAEVISPPGAGDSGWMLKNLEAFAVEQRADLIHFNVGLHDLRFGQKTKAYQVDLEGYTKNLEAICARLKKETKATLIFATTTPIDDGRHAKRKGGYDRFEKDVRRYNEAALGVVRRQGIPVHDLHSLVHEVGASKLLGTDGTHYTEEGKARLAEAVTDSVRRHLLLRATKPGAFDRPADPEAGAKYRKSEAERDALVPPQFRKLPVGRFTAPKDGTEWQGRRPGVRSIVVGSLGDQPARPKPSARLVSREIHETFVLESLTIPNGLDGEMTAYLLLPHTRRGASPTILWLHSSSYDRNQLLMPGYNGGAEPLGLTFVQQGYVVFAPDAAWYGGRALTGPSGSAEAGRLQQESLLKYHLWFGRTLWGMFVRDDQVALDYLCTRPEVDVKRIGATGMSMGSTRAWWLGAVDERIACVVGIACLTRYENLMRHGQLRQHGLYYFVQGLLKHFDSEGVVALIAPRPFLALNGDLDAGSPADGIRAIEEQVAKVYAAVGAKERFRSILYKDTGHVVTPEMRREMLAWFARWLKTPG